MLAEKINKWYLAVQEVLLCLMIIALPFMKLPSRYGLFGMGTNLPVVLGSVSVILFLVYSVYKREMHIPFKKFFLIAILWMFICEVWGVLTFPYYDEAIYEYLRDTRVVKLFYQWIPSLEDMNIFLHFKLLGSQLWYLVREMVFPLMGIVCIILTLYRRHALHFVNLMTKMAYILIIMMSAYLVIERSFGFGRRHQSLEIFW